MAASHQNTTGRFEALCWINEGFNFIFLFKLIDVQSWSIRSCCETNLFSFFFLITKLSKLSHVVQNVRPVRKRTWETGNNHKYNIVPEDTLMLVHVLHVRSDVRETFRSVLMTRLCFIRTGRTKTLNFHLLSQRTYQCRPPGGVAIMITVITVTTSRGRQSPHSGVTESS